MMMGFAALISGCLVLAAVLEAAPAGDGKDPSDYMQERNSLLLEEDSMFLGGSCTLNEEEEKLNKVLMELKKSDFQQSTQMPFMRYFTYSRDEVRSSRTYEILKSMPKGAVLHVHEMATVSPDFIIRNLTYRKDLYVCMYDGKMRFTFYQDTSCNWKEVSCARQEVGEAEFDEYIKGNLSFYKRDIDRELLQFHLGSSRCLETYPTIGSIWKSFEGYFTCVKDLIIFEEVLPIYVYQSFQEMYDDNVMYAEIRTVLPQAYTRDGTLLPKSHLIKVYRDEAEKFKQDHPGFHGVKLILCGYKSMEVKELESDYEEAQRLQDEFPDVVIGYDVVGYEDMGKSLLEYKDVFLNASNLFFVFHAGETLWHGTRADENVIDSLLLGSKRIGHGLSLPKHPVVQKRMMELCICLEVNPISNQILSLMPNLQMHPLIPLFTTNHPIVVSSDDPALWQAAFLTDDVYMAFMALGGEKADLRFLKQLMINSIQCSLLSREDKMKVMDDWTKLWSEFVSTMNAKLSKEDL